MRDPNATACFSKKDHRPVSALSKDSCNLTNMDRRNLSSFLKRNNEEMLKYEDAKVLLEEMDEIPDIKPQDIKSALKVMKVL